MSISESLFLGDPAFDRNIQQAEAAPAQDVSDQLAESLTGLFMIRQTQQDRSPRGRVIVFRGKMVADSAQAYPVIAERFATLNYTAMLDHVRGQDVVAAVEGLIKGRTFTSPRWLHALLLLLTVITTAISGAAFTGYGTNAVLTAIGQGRFSTVWRYIQYGAPFALTLLLILGVHEMGHYFAARRHGVDTTLPYFIPIPFLSLLGTLGAVIVIKSPLTNRKALFDVGISGPLAGFIVALIAFVIGINLPSMGTNRLFFDAFGSDRLGVPLLLQFIGGTLRPDLNLTVFIARQPIALAAWFGMFLTVLNLIPIGQLDGGHIMYALFGRVAWVIATLAFGALIALGLSVFPSFLFYAFLALLTGLRHPAPNDDLTPLGWPRRLLGYGTIAMFFLILTLQPFQGLGR